MNKLIPFVLLIVSVLFVNDVTAQSRIVNGTRVAEGDYPWMVGLSSTANPADHFCGASLIGDQWVLTAAHCLEGVSAADVQVFLNTYYLTNASPGEVITVDQVFMHPSYDPANLNNDVALLHLSSASSQPHISLPTQGDNSLTGAGTVHKVMGWGLLQDASGMYPDTMNEVDVPIVADATCNDASHYNGDIVLPTMMCAGYSAGMQDACSGDSGGPLVTMDGSSNYVQTGVVSWGTGCADPMYPGVYARVSEFRDWIDGVIAGSPASTNDIEADKSSVEVFYNNNSQMLHIRYNDALESFDNITVVGMNGAVIYQNNNVTSNDVSIRFDDYASGLYVVNVSNDEEVVSEKVIK